MRRVRRRCRGFGRAFGARSVRACSCVRCCRASASSLPSSSLSDRVFCSLPVASSSSPSLSWAASVATRASPAALPAEWARACASLLTGVGARLGSACPVASAFSPPGWVVTSLVRVCTSYSTGWSVSWCVARILSCGSFMPPTPCGLCCARRLVGVRSRLWLAAEG